MTIFANEATQTSKGKPYYDFRAKLTEYNFKIEQVKRTTGLNLSQFTIEEDGFSTYDADGIVEITKVSRPNKCFHRYEDEVHYGYSRLVEAMMDNFLTACKCREHLLSDFQRTWDYSPSNNTCLHVHYGLYYATIMVPVEAIAKYQMLLQPGHFYGNYSATWLKEIGEFWLKFAWTEQGRTDFDNQVYFLGWKIEEYQKKQRAREEILHAHQQCQRFFGWENRVLNLPSQAP